MSKLSYTIEIALMSAVLMTIPCGFQIEDAAAQMSRADMAAIRAAVAKTSAAAHKSQRAKEFIDAVKSRNDSKVNAILVSNGASDSIDEVMFDGPKNPAKTAHSLSQWLLLSCNDFLSNYNLRATP